VEQAVVLINAEQQVGFAPKTIAIRHAILETQHLFSAIMNMRC
jgi:hypothetical protein